MTEAQTVQERLRISAELNPKYWAKVDQELMIQAADRIDELTAALRKAKVTLWMASDLSIGEFDYTKLGLELNAALNPKAST